MPSMIIWDRSQGLLVWGNFGDFLWQLSDGREDVDVDVIQPDMSAGIALIILCQSVTTDIRSRGIEVRVCGQPHLSSLIGKRVGFPWFHFFPNQKIIIIIKKIQKEILCMPSESLMLPFISDICLASASWTSSYCLFITCFALITCSWWWRPRRCWWRWGPQRNRIVTLIGITASLSSLKSFGQLWSVSGKTKGGVRAQKTGSPMGWGQVVE